ncbi:MAG: hypothetical protein Q9174_004239 [Haloplaca sp. 1 TL-2023]
MHQPIYLLALVLLLNVRFAKSADGTKAAVQGEQPSRADDLAWYREQDLTNVTQIFNETGPLDFSLACFEKSTRSTVELRLVRFMDCYSGIARAMLLGDDVMERKRWGEGNTPFSWNAGSCMFVLDPGDGKASDIISKAEIAHVAAQLTLFCVTRRQEDERLGGQAEIGSSGHFSLNVLGRKWPQ